MSVGPEDFTQYDWFGEARSLEATGKFEEALKAYEEAIKIDAEFAKAWFYKAQLHHKLGQVEEAIRCAKEAIRLKPEWANHVRKFLPDI